MSAGLSGIGPVSVRYAHQIKELLNVQAMQRVAAEQKAALESAQAGRVEAARPAPADDEPVKVDVKTQPPEPAKPAAPVEAPAPKEPVAAVGQLVDEMA